MTKNRIQTVMDKIRGDREFFSWIGGIVIATIMALTWFSANFATTARAEEIVNISKAGDDALAKEIRVLTVSVQKSNKLLSIHMEKGELDNVMQQIKDNQTQTFNIGQFTRVNGMDSQSEARLQQLESELGLLELKRDCIITINPLCN